MAKSPDPEIIAIARASAGRRYLGVGMLSLLGLMVINIAFSTAPGIGFQLLLALIGVASIWMAFSMWRATESRIELTEEELRDADGTVIARIEDIEGVDRGFFAFKPSNGFLLKTRSAGTNTWRPGLWWRVGRRIGVGGMTPAHQSKAMSEIIAAQHATRQMEADGEM